MPIKIDVNLTEEYMYDFMKYHNNSHLSGIVAKIVGYVALIFVIIDIAVRQYGDAVMWAAVAGILLLYLPSILRKKAKMQVKNSPMFNKTLEVWLKDEGVLVKQDGAEALNEWENFTKVVSTKKCLILYVGRVRAFIFPKPCIGDKYEEVVEMLRKHIPAKLIKIRR